MPDEVTRALSQYAVGVGGELPAATSDEVRRKLIDVIGCAIGAVNEPAPQAVRRYVYALGATGPSLLWGTGVRTSPQAAAIANGAAVRCFDFNDGYQGIAGDGGHPSDLVPALVGVAESVGCSGHELAVAIAIAYEVMVTMTDGMRVKVRGLVDHINALGMAVCCGVARLTGMSAAELEEALAITVVAHVGLLQTRKNEITMWKSVAAGNASRNAIEACALARAGVRGPSRPFEGNFGYLKMAGDETGLNWSVMDSLLELQAPTKITKTNMKIWPVGQVGQGSVDMAAQLHSKIDNTADIKEIVISTFAAAARDMCRPENWNPQNRETADHSLPYATVAALFDGGVSPSTFHEDRLETAGIREVLATKVRLDVLDEFTTEYPAAQPARVEVFMNDGRHLVAETRYPRGHANNRPSDDDYRAKFNRLATTNLGPRLEHVRDTIEAIDSLDHVRILTDELML
jgi:2-methylcitrate dehydratase